MLTFRDAEGRPWTIRLTAYAIGRVKEKTGLDLFAILDDWPKSVDRLTSDMAVFVNAVYLLATSAKDAPAVSEDDFCRAVDGETLDAMSEAFHSAVLDFFRRSPRGPALAKVKEKSDRLTKLLGEKALRQADGIDPETLLAEIEKAAAGKTAAPSKSASGDSPALSVFTPDPSPSAS